MREGAAGTHIHGMQSADFKTLRWLVPLAAVLSLWLLFRADPCFDASIGNRWHEMFPPTIEQTVSSTDADSAGDDTVRVENPYGIVACDFWPTERHQIETMLLFAFVAVFVGFLGGRFLTARPVRHAGMSMLIGLLPACALELWVDLPRFIEFAGTAGHRMIVTLVLIWLAIVGIAALFSMLSAWLTVKIRARG